MAHFATTFTPTATTHRYSRYSRTNRTTTTQTSTPRSNAYGAKCRRCHQWVEPLQGLLTNAGGQWVVAHTEPCPEPVEAPQAAPTATVAPSQDAVTFPVPDGRYTLVWSEQGEHRKTIRVSTQDADADFMPGRVILAHLTGSDNDADYTRFGHVDAQGTVRIWKRFAAIEGLREAVKVLIDSPQKAAESYAMESGNCSRCGRTLTVPASLNAGLGPECAKRVSW